MPQSTSEKLSEPSVVATPLQQGMMFHGLRDSGSGVDIEQITIRSERRLEADHLQAAFASLIDRHDALRAAFDWDGDGEPRIDFATGIRIDIDEHDLDSTAVDEPLGRYLDLDRRRGFDLDRAPLMRAALFSHGQGSTLVWTFHHALIDGRSFAPLLEDLFRYYDDSDWQPRARPPFRDYVEWLSSVDHESAIRFWAKYLESLPGPCVFPTLLASPQQSGGGSVERRLSEAATSAIVDSCQAAGVSVNALLQAAWGTLLHHYTGEPEVVFGATYTTRHCDYPDASSIVGLLINTLPVRLDFSDDPSVAGLLDRLSSHARDVRPHVLAPLHLVQQQMPLSGDLALFDTAVVFDRLTLQDTLMQRQPDWRHLHCSYRGQTNFALTLVAYGGERLSLNLEFDRSRIDAPHAEAVFDSFCLLVERFARSLTDVAARISPLSDDERAEKLSADLQPATGEPVCLHTLFREVASRYPDNPAVRYEDRMLSYAELDSVSDRVARALRRAGVGNDDRVGLCMRRSTDLIVSLLGILKAGAAYVPIDPNYPESRIEFTLTDAGIRHVVTDEQTEAGLQRFACERLIISELRDSNADADLSTAVTTDPDSLAYVIYTSGSTGKPKGVAVTHNNVVRLLRSTQHWFEYSADDKWTLFHSIAFDWTVHEIWGALGYGGELTVVPYWVSRSADDFYRLLSSNRITVLCQTPSAFVNLLEADEAFHAEFPLELRQIVFGGEALDIASLHPWFARYGDSSPRIANMYGITETTVHVTYRRIREADLRSNAGSVIGEPIPDLDVLLLNRYGQPVPTGAMGEIHVAGAGLAREYLNRADLTRERFSTSVSGELRGIRLYRSGDLARWLPDGDMVYCGRSDFQVKIRGFRIELGEIEHAIASLTDVKQAIVVAHTGTAGRTHLIGYYVSTSVLPEAVRTALSETLPAHMVPSKLLRLPSFPLTANGKIDRKALPDPEITVGDQDYKPPVTEAEKRLTAIWQELLGVERIGIDDNFFERGGDSILSIQLISRARKAGIELTARDIYNTPTIAGLVGQSAEKSLTPVASTGVVAGTEVPMLPVQQWFFDAVGGVPHWNQSFCFLLETDVSVAAIAKALETVCQRHPVLGSRFEFEQERWRMIAGDFASVDVREYAVVEDEDRLGAIDDVNRQTDFRSGANLSAGVLTDTDGNRELCLAVHHLVVDGISWSVLIHELDEALGRGDNREGREYAFADWSRLLTAERARFDHERRYWESACRPQAGGDEAPSFRHAESYRLRTELGDIAWPDRCGVSRQTLVVAAFVKALAMQTSSRSVQFDLESHGRSHDADAPDLSAAVGWFTSIFPVAVNVADVRATETLLESVQRALQGVPKLGIGFGALQLDGKLPSRSGASHLFNYMGNFCGLFDDCRNLKLVEPDYRSWRDADAGHSHAAEWVLGLRDSSLYIDVFFDPDVVSASTLGELSEKLLANLKQLNTLVTEGALSDDHLRVSIDTWNRVSAEFDSPARILPVSPIQDLYLLGGGGVDIATEHWSFRLEGSLDIDALREAWLRTLHRHSVMCTTFHASKNGGYVQAFHDRPRIEWHATGRIDDAAFETIQAERLSENLDIGRGPLHRFLLAETSASTWHLIWTHHHAQVDGWSWPMLMQQVHARYRHIAGEDAETLERNSDYVRYIEWLANERPKVDADYWSSYLEALNDEGRLPVVRTDKRGVLQHEVTLAEPSFTNLDRRVREHGVTMSSVLHATVAKCLAHLLGRQAVCIGSTYSGRVSDTADFSDVLGPFVTNLPVRVDTTGSLDDVLGRVHDRMIELQDKQFHSVSEVQAAAGVPWTVPLFECLVVVQNYAISEETFDLGARLEIVEKDLPVRTAYPLTIVASPGEALKIEVIYDSGRLSDEFVLDLCTNIEMSLSSFGNAETLSLTQKGSYATQLESPDSVLLKSVPAETETETEVLAIWRGIFGDDRIGVTDNFFDIGGRSIMVPILMRQIAERLGSDVPVTALFREPTVRGLATRFTPRDEEALDDRAARHHSRSEKLREARERAKLRRRRVRSAGDSRGGDDG